MKHNKKELPIIAKLKKDSIHSMCFDDEKGAMITVYQCKPSKSVILLSTLHERFSIPATFQKGLKTFENVKKKPDTIFTYNKTKCAVDSADQMSRNISVQAPTRRWPIQVC